MSTNDPKLVSLLTVYASFLGALIQSMGSSRQGLTDIHNYRWKTHPSLYNTVTSEHKVWNTIQALNAY